MGGRLILGGSIGSMLKCASWQFFDFALFIYLEKFSSSFSYIVYLSLTIFSP